MNKARALYVHIPFCVKKCAYCDFVSAPSTQQIMKDYADAIIRELGLMSALADTQSSAALAATRLDTVFFGGGTPTLMPLRAMERVIKAINTRFSLHTGYEFTLEANPDTVTSDYLKMLRDNGVNRLSFGVQSLDDRLLKRIGRVHDSKAAIKAYEMARTAGFRNINIDLMLGLPSQTIEDVAHTIDLALQLEPEHISCYSLILEEDTPMYDENPNDLPDEISERAMYHYAAERFHQNGLPRYEISNFSKPGYECRHNLTYWNADEYIGVGIAAHSYTDGARYHNTFNLEDYLQGDFSSYDTENLTHNDLISEFMFLGLRKTAGISRAEFFTRFNTPLEAIFDTTIKALESDGLLETDGDMLRLTNLGFDLSNRVFSAFLL